MGNRDEVKEAVEEFRAWLVAPPKLNVPYGSQYSSARIRLTCAVELLEAENTRANEAENERQRLWDLVRHQRAELFTEALISQKEYAALAFDHDAVGRLHSYDDLREERDRLSARCARSDALCRWLANTVMKQQDAFLDDDFPESAREWVMMNVPRVQGLSVNMKLRRIGEAWDKERDSDLVRAALDADSGVGGPVESGVELVKHSETGEMVWLRKEPANVTETIPVCNKSKGCQYMTQDRLCFAGSKICEVLNDP